VTVGPTRVRSDGRGGCETASVSSSEYSSLREAWETHAQEWVAWSRRPGHDSFDRFHREQFLSLVPAPGRLTVDVGCGEGRLSRALKAAGHNVVGVDCSATLVAAAREAEPLIPVYLADAAMLPLADGEADLALAFMSLQDIDDMEGAVRELARVLTAGGCLRVAIVHPINSAGRFSSDAPDSPFVVEGSYLDVHRYTRRLERDELTMTFHSEHSPLERYAKALERNGLLIEALREPAVPERAVRDAASRRWQRVPLFLHLRARKLSL
jgi:SAM-dependent methyltransferase